MLSIYLIIKSASISQTIKRIEAKQSYNKERKILLDAFKGYRDSIVLDGNQSTDLRHRLLTDTYKFAKKYKEIITIYENFILFQLRFQLKSSKPKYDKIPIFLDYLIARFDIKEHEHYE